MSNATWHHEDNVMSSINFITEKSNQIWQPDDFPIQLRPHHLALLYEMLDIEENRNLCRKSDTYQANFDTDTCFLALSEPCEVILALVHLTKDKEYNDYSNVHYRNGNKHILVSFEEKEKYEKQTIVVCSAKKCKKWVDMAKNANVKALLYDPLKGSKIVDGDFVNTQIFIVSDDLFRTFLTVYESKYWKRIVLDTTSLSRISQCECRFLWVATLNSESLFRSKCNFLTERMTDLKLQHVTQITLTFTTSFLKHSLEWTKPKPDVICCKMCPSLRKIWTNADSRKRFLIDRDVDVGLAICPFCKLEYQHCTAYSNSKIAVCEKLAKDRSDTLFVSSNPFDSSDVKCVTPIQVAYHIQPNMHIVVLHFPQKFEYMQITKYFPPGCCLTILTYERNITCKSSIF